jgi:hypothetical protein
MPRRLVQDATRADNSKAMVKDVDLLIALIGCSSSAEVT